MTHNDDSRNIPVAVPRRLGCIQRGCDPGACIDWGTTQRHTAQNIASARSLTHRFRFSTIILSQSPANDHFSRVDSTTDDMEQLKDPKFVTTVSLPEPPKQLSRLPNAKIQYPKWFGGSASLFAVVFSHPLDLIKVRHQTAAGTKQSITSTVISVVRIEGIKGLYRGLSASMLRQLTYGSTRFAIYESLKDRALAKTKGDKLPMTFLMSASTFSGACGAIVGNPADIANVRMQNDRSLPNNLRKNYRSIFDVLARMAREEGVGGFVRGIFPNAIRSGCMTGCQLGSYDWFKDMLEKVFGMGNGGMATQFSASVLAGLVATTLCNPIDVVKTRIMSGNSNGMSVMRTVTDMTRTDGLRWMLRGWLPSFSRLGPHTVATLLLLEQHKKLYRQLYKRE